MIHALDMGRIASLESSARAALPALAEHRVPGWLVRVSGGKTKRVNSANATEPGATVAAVRGVAEHHYAAAGLPTRFRLTPLAAPASDRLLADAGYAPMEHSLTMVAPLPPRPVDPMVRIGGRADTAWCAGMAVANGWCAADDAAHRALLERLPAGSAVAVLDQGSGPLAFGAAGFGEGRVCLFDIVVTPAARGRGLGRRLVAGLLGWAAASGHREAMLQVFADNRTARSLYASLGFVDAYPYHYRVGGPT